MSLRPVGRPIAAASVAAFLALMPSGSAFAHASLQDSDPAANSVLVDPPVEIVLDFDEDVESALSSIRLYASDGTEVELGDVVAGADSSMVMATMPGLADGLYAVVWQVASGDGHVVDGAFSFQVGTAVVGDGGALVDQVRGSGDDTGTLEFWYGIARVVSLTGVALCIGSLGWMVAGLGSVVAARRLVVVRWVAAALFAAGSVGVLVAFSVRTDAASLGDVANTTTGRMLLARVLLAVPVVALVARWRANASTAWRTTAVAVAIAVSVSCAASGHPNQLDPAVLWVAFDALHVVAMSVWFGGLVVLALADGALLREPEAVRPVRRFSAVSTAAVAVVVATGVAQGVRLAGGIDDVTATDWGRLLSVKVTVVVAVVGIAGVSRWLLQHEGPGSLRRTVLVEAVAGVVVLAIAATMVGFAPRVGAATLPFDGQLVSGGTIASVSISPGRVGPNEVHILVTPPGGSLTAVDSATARVSLPSASIPASPVALVGEGPNHFSGTITFQRAGDWTFELVLVTGSTSTLVTATVPIP